MPEISDAEYKKFKELVEKENREKKQQEIDNKIYITKLSEKVDALIDLNNSYGSVEVYALTFVKFLYNDFKAHNTDVLFFKWSEIERYLTDTCLKIDEKTGFKKLKKSFRDHLLYRGIKTKINRKYNTFKVMRCAPKKKKR